MLTKLTSSIIFEPYLFIKIDILYKITYLILFLMILFLFLFLPLKNYYYFVDLFIKYCFYSTHRYITV